MEVSSVEFILFIVIVLVLYYIVPARFKSILLPRYVMSGEDSLDLLSYDTNLFFEEDVFGEYKSVFASALIKETDIVDGFHLMA